MSTGDGSWVWQSPLPQGNDIASISCPTASRCYAAADQVILLSADGGTSWQKDFQLAATPNGLDSAILALDCPSAMTCYGLVSIPTGGMGDEVIITTNGGNTWSPHTAGGAFFHAGSSLSCPNQNVCFALASTQVSPFDTVIAMTGDGGQTWTSRTLQGVRNLQGLGCPTALVCTAVGGTQSDPVRSIPQSQIIVGTTDGWSSWRTEVSNGQPSLEAVSCPSVTTCYATGKGYPGSNGPGVMATKDGGASWSTQSSVVTAHDITCPTTSTCYAANVPGPAGIYATNDGGTTWTPQDSPSSQASAVDFLSISCPTGSVCFTAGVAGLIDATTSSGASWQELSSGARADFQDVSCADVTVCFAVADGVTVKTADAGSTWSVLAQGPGGESISCPTESTCYAVVPVTNSPTAIWKTADGGTTWTAVASFPALAPAPLFITCPGTSICYTAGTSGQILGTKDGGVTWPPQNSGSTQTLGPLTCASTTECFVLGDNLRRTTDGGATWQLVSNSPGVPGPSIRQRIQCPSLSTCWGIWSDTILVSHDMGVTWNSFPRIGGTFYGTLSCPNPGTCYAGTGPPTRVVASTDGGNTWVSQAVGANLPFNGFKGLACPAPDHCWGVGAGGAILTLAIPPPLASDSGRPWTGGSDAVGAAAGATDAYFAEGYTGANFEEYLTVLNPGPAQTMTADYLLSDGTVITESYGLSANSRTTIHVNADVGFGQQVSTHLHAANPIVAERPMYFDYPSGITGGHDASGAMGLGQTFYFAEGFTGPGFTEYLTLMNPGSVAANVTVTYLYDRGTAPKTVPHTVAAHSRGTIQVNDPAEAGPGRAVSVQLTSTQPILAERPMYFNYFGETGGSDVVGATSLMTEMNLAEGHVGQGFDEYLTLLNPNTQAAQATITYYLGSGSPLTQQVSLAQQSRTTVHVNDVLPAGTDSSVHVHSTLPILVERPMYFTYNGWTGGHDAVAVPDSAMSATLSFAEGFVSPSFAEYYTIMNRNAQAAHVTITYYDPSGTAHSKSIVIPAQSRWTETVNKDLPAYTPNSAVITSDVPILAERPMYFAY